MLWAGVLNRDMANAVMWFSENQVTYDTIAIVIRFLKITAIWRQSMP